MKFRLVFISGIIVLSLSFCWFFFSSAISTAAQAEDISEQVREPVGEAVQIRRETQEEREEWHEERQKLIDRYDQLQAENERLAEEQADLQAKVEGSREAIASKEQQLADIEEIARDIEPFLEQQLQRIAETVHTNVPFLQEERQKRLQDLKQMLAEDQEPVSEQYRRIMEALLVEAEYGRSIEVYQQSIQIEDRSIRANIFRLGRLSLFYQTMDQEESGWFNVAQGEWQKLPARHNRAISKAIDIASERQPVELLTLPLGRMVVQ